MKHSILGAGMPLQSNQPLTSEGFMRGLGTARESGATGAFSRLFSARALLLAGELPADQVTEFLSGLLIGEEFRIALLRDGGHTVPLCLIGEASLCQRYATAATFFGYATPTVIVDAAAQGLWQLASAAGLLTQAKLHSYSGVET
jgi:2-dehydro-3-deoxygalactonokinase